ncbi:MAG: HyaD/HybD family hydrogenase maturation endopeptidase [Moorellales bacterium]
MTVGDCGAATPKITVIGLGNLLLGDEGVGIHALRELSRLEDWPPGVEFVDAGTAGLDLLPFFDGAELVIIIDCIKAEGTPGAVYRFPLEVLENSSPNAGAEIMSLHDLDLNYVLRLLRVLGRAPTRVVIYGVEPKEIAWGLELSTTVAQALPRLVEAVRQEIRDWLESGS